LPSSAKDKSTVRSIDLNFIRLAGRRFHKEISLLVRQFKPRVTELQSLELWSQLHKYCVYGRLLQSCYDE